MTIKRLDILNYLAKALGYQTYLEIGVAGGSTFKGITVRDKTGVDPTWRWWYLSHRSIHKVTSDRFFAGNRRNFDLVLIDGLHIADQAHKDIKNALNCLSPNGSILVHDCLPTSREQQEVPRSQVSWTGTVWRAFLKASQDRTLDTLVFDTDRGCGLIRRGSPPEGSPRPPSDIDVLSPSLTWEEFDDNKERWLRLISRDTVFETIDFMATWNRIDQPIENLQE